MTDTASSPAFWRNWSEMLVLSINNYSRGYYVFTQDAHHDWGLLTWGLISGFDLDDSDCTSGDISSSISVTSVPTDVTGEGPTISLGLMRKLLAEEGRAAMDGRREVDSGA